MIKKLDEDALLRAIAWLFGQACIWLFLAGAAFFIIQCFYFAYHGTWPALPASLFFVEHGEGLRAENEAGIRHPALLIPNVFDTGPWQSWIGIWNFIDFISTPALFIIFSVLSLILSVISLIFCEWLRRETL